MSLHPSSDWISSIEHMEDNIFWRITQNQPHSHQTAMCITTEYSSIDISNPEKYIPLKLQRERISNVVRSTSLPLISPLLPLFRRTGAVYNAYNTIQTW